MVNAVLVISDEYPPEGGGAGVIARRMILDMTALGYKITLITGDEAKEVHSNIIHYKVRRKRFIWPLAYRKIFKQLDMSGYDHIVLNDFVSVYLAGLFFDIQTLQRCIVIVHGNDSDYVFTKKTEKHLLFRYVPKYERAIKYCKHIVAVSIYAKELFIQYLPGALKNISIDYAYAGVTAEDFDMQKAISRHEMGLPEEAKILFTACRLAKVKGIFDQLQLFSQLCKKYNNLYWIVAGEGPEQQDFANNINQLGLSNRVILLGRVNRRDIGAYYKVSDIFWMLSVRETMGLVYIEAALFGTPSIGPEKSGIKEAIAPGVSGFFYNPETFESDIEYCLQHDMSESCRQHASKYQTINFTKHVLGLK